MDGDVVVASSSRKDDSDMVQQAVTPQGETQFHTPFNSLICTGLDSTEHSPLLSSPRSLLAMKG
eukprot:scaffold184393_cov28-Tisochrysis_lutea.AAC.2